MAQVTAILQAATTVTTATTTLAPVNPTPTPVTMLGSPTLAKWVATTDLTNSRVQYGYLVYQTYSAGGSATGMAQATGTSAWVSIPNVSGDFPNVDVSGLSATSGLAGGVVTFTIAGNISYTQTTPGLYSVTTA